MLDEGGVLKQDRLLIGYESIHSMNAGYWGELELEFRYLLEDLLEFHQKGQLG